MEQADATVQKNAQALGMAYMCRELHAFVKEIADYGESEVFDQTSGVQDPS